MQTILRLFLGFLADFVVAFLKNFQAARADNPALIEVAATVMGQIADAHPEWSGEQKRSYAFSAIQEAWKELLKDALKSAGASAVDVLSVELPANADSITNFLIEMIVQKKKAAL